MRKLRSSRRIGLHLAWVAVTSLLIAAPALGQTGVAEGFGVIDFDAEAFDAYVAAAVESWGAPGLAIAVVKDGEVLFERGYGVLELGRPERVDEHTRFSIGSTTKAMTAAALGMLVDEGKLRWDDPVTRHLPRFQLYDPFVTRELTVRDLLTHRAGLGNADFLWYGQETTAEEILEKVRLVEPAYSLRAGFIYQNIMYLAAGAVVEAVAGMPWEDFVQQRIFEPLGMDGTVPLLARTLGQPNVASPHFQVGDDVVVIENASVDPVAPAGAVWSSVHDMARWLNLLLAGGETPGGERLLEARTVDELFRQQVVLRPQQLYPTVRLTRPSWAGYGFGWFQHDYRGKKIDFHTGSIDGMVAIAGLVRDEKLGVYVLANRDHVEIRHALMYRVFDLFDPHGGDPRDWSADLKELYDGLAATGEAARARRLGGRVSGTSPSQKLEAYGGTYEDALYGRVEVEPEGGALRLTYGPGLSGPVEHWHYDTFLVRWDMAWRGESFVTFRLDAAGNVVSLDMNGASLQRTSSR